MNKSDLLHLASLRNHSLKDALAAAPELIARVFDAASDAADAVAHALRGKRAVDATASPSPTDDAERSLHDTFVLAPILARADLAVVADLAGVDDAVTTRLFERAPTTAALDAETLRKLVDERHLTADQAAGIARATTLHELVGRDVSLARTVADVANGASTEELAAWTADTWSSRLAKTVSDRDERASRAADLATRFAKLHPGAAFIGRLPPATTSSPAIAASYPGLGLDQILADSSLDSAAKQAELSRRVQLVNDVQHAHGDTWLQTDLSRPDATATLLDDAKVPAADRPQVASTLKAYQRVYALGGDVDTSHMLLMAGYSSATSVATASPQALMAKGVPAAKADRVWSDARRSLAETTVAMGSLLDAYRRPDIRFLNTLPDARNLPIDLPGWEQLFGALGTCACDACSSILSPAAYFVDLMRFVDEYLRPQLPTPDHPLDLHVRRGDLWTLPLTCENTDTRIAVLEIVNEILENYIAKLHGYSGSLADRAAIAAAVYPTRLATTTNSFGQPFHLPTVRVDTYLAALESSRREVVSALRGPTDQLAAAELGMDDASWTLATTAHADLPTLSRIYGMTFAGSAAAIDEVDVRDLERGTGLDRQQLGAALASAFVRAGGSHVEIRAERRSTDSIQNDIERVRGLSGDVLDRLHRFTRIARGLPWTFDELDRVLSAIGESSLAAPGVRRIAEIRALQRSLGLSPDLIAGFVGVAPRETVFDRAFNPRETAAADRLPSSASFIHPAFRTTTAVPADPVLPRLLAGLRLDLAELATLIRALAPTLGADPDAATEAARAFVLSEPNLDALWRHAAVARTLGLEIAPLFALLGLLGRTSIAGENDLRAVVDLRDWIRASNMSIDDVERAVGTGDTASEQTRVLDEIVAGSDDLEFRDAVFAVSLGVTETASREILVANTSLVEEIQPGRWRVRAGVDLAAATLAIPASATVPVPPASSRPLTADEVLDVLAAYRAHAVLARRLGRAFGIDATKVEALARIADQALDAAPLDGALRTRDRAALSPLVASLIPYAMAFAHAVWTAERIDFVRARRAAFGIGASIDLHALRSLALFVKLATRAEPDHQAERSDDLATAIAAFDPGTASFPATVDRELGRVLDANAGLVAALRGRVPLPAVALDALAALDTVVAVATRLGIDGESLAAVGSGAYDARDRAANALYAALRARMPDETMRAAKLEEIEQPLRERKRDALVAYLLRSLPTRLFGTVSDLYEYFLIDVEAGGCATTSRIVAATSSVQLWIHRITMNLEQTAPGAPTPAVIRMPPEVAGEWTWRQNYRVWEANRKVFLWPENYIQPDLRDDKTPLFKELESELLQTDITDDNVVDAYTKYLAQLETLSTLTIAGAYHDRNVVDERETDRLHLFGVTSTDPPQLYYRTCDDLIASARDATRPATWSPWSKVAVQLTARRVSPIVHLGRLHLFWTEFATRPLSRVQDGNSEFNGYRHTMSVKSSTLRPDDTWTPPQPMELPLTGWFDLGRGLVTDRTDGNHIVHLAGQRHDEPADDYTLRGPNWEWLFFTPIELNGEPRLRAQYRDFLALTLADMFERRLSSGYYTTVQDPLVQVLAARGSTLYRGSPPPGLYQFLRPATANLLIEDTRIAQFQREISGFLNSAEQQALYAQTIGTLRAGSSLFAVPGAEEDTIIQNAADVLLLQGTVTDDDSYVLRRIGTTLARDVAYRLFVDGLGGLLATSTQQELGERPPGLTNAGRFTDQTNTGDLDFDGPYGVYYRELFFHIPFLIANALNARGRFEAAQRWYHFLFDPTATEVITLLPGLTAEQRVRRLLDRVWRYMPFRGQDAAKLRDLLTDPAALRKYRTDPFNPDAIARFRISGYQKAVVMKYIDNILDWADHLFTQFTMESVNEALMLYIMAAEILGDRPDTLGDCGDKAAAPKTYEQIARDQSSGSSEILVELETWVIGRRTKSVPPQKKADLPLKAKRAASIASDASKASHNATASKLANPLWKQPSTASWHPSGAIATVKDNARLDRAVSSVVYHDGILAGGFGWSIVRQFETAFCVPENKDLLAYWDRVEDRLYKLRHCMDIDGVKRELALFAPAIDPAMLARMRAAGVSLDDVVGSTSGSLPPYRFTYLIERAKSFASTLIGFGASLLAAFERKDAEELARLRMVQQGNLTRMSTQLRTWEIAAAQDALASVTAQRDAAIYRRDYHRQLVQNGRSPMEELQSISRHVASGVYTAEAITQIIRGIVALVPQVGSPFSMKWGGAELTGAAAGFAAMAKGLAQAAEAIAASTGLEAGFERRREGWDFQAELADRDIAQLQKQVAAAEIRVQMAEKGLALHELQLTQLDEQLELFDGKFTNLGLYTWLAAQLRRLYRDAYQNALAIARLAEEAYRFERGEDEAPSLATTYWEGGRAGLLAGERLMIDLQNLERRFIETNYRSLEVDQAFALTQIAPDALVALREKGECSFTIPELAFDLHYPGHFKRRVKGVRLTIPCITGPFVNVGATLDLERSWIRARAMDPDLTEVPPRRSVTIATSTAQNDAGVFELSFRDERYMPFEGAGAISRWRLTLPRSFRQFDYDTINDVIVSISYTAELDGALRDKVEIGTATVQSRILQSLRTVPLKRVFSLRQEFSSTFTRLLHSPPGTAIPLQITDRNFPALFKGRAFHVTAGRVILRVGGGHATTGVALAIDGGAVTGFSGDPTLGDLPAAVLPGPVGAAIQGTHTITVTAPGPLASTTPGEAFDDAALEDILLYVELQLD